MAQYSAVGFHLMKVSLWNQIVKPPSTTTSTRLTQSIVSTLRRRAFSHPTCANVAKMTTIVANITGASPGPTWPPEDRRPKCSVAKLAAHALWPSVNLKVAKNSRIGRKSSTSFMVRDCARRTRGRERQCAP